MLQIGICDDSSEARFALQTALERLLEERGTQYAIFTFSSGVGLLGWYAKHAGELDLVFLDMEMDGLSGMDTARALRLADPTILLAFVTGYPDYVFDGYTVGALGYLLKPPRPEQLKQLLSRALAALVTQEEKIFLCRNNDGLYRIPRENIRYFFSQGRRVACVTPSRQITFYGKLSDVAETLGAGFVRIHQRYLVRAAAVERVEGNTLVVAGETLPISRAYHASALATLARTLLE